MGRDPNMFERPDLIAQFIQNCAAAGLTVQVYFVDRTLAQQTALYAQGRQSLDDVNALRVTAGMTPSLTDSQNKEVTWTMNSKHVVGSDGKSRAFDFLILKNGAADWTDLDLYKQCATIGESLGLVSGFSFPHIDADHLELPNGA